MASAELNDDFVDLLQAFLDAEVEFVVVGAHALAAHGIARATGDIDILVRRSTGNAARVLKALVMFGAPVAAHGITTADFTVPDNVYQIGLPPRRIDILTGISGVEFDEADSGKITSHVSGLTLPFLGLDTLIKNKRASARPKDLLDIAALEQLRPSS